MRNHLSPRRLAAAIGVSESSIKRWVDEGKIPTHVTAGGHRRISVEAAIRFVRESRAELIDPVALGIASEGFAPPMGPDEKIAALHGHLIHGRTDAAVELIRFLYVSGMDSARIIDEPFRIVMEQFGRSWHDQGDAGVFREHRGTQIGLRILFELRAMHGPPADSAPIALGGAPQGDPYLLPTLAAAIVIESAGFKTSNLGPDTPDSAFVSAIENVRPCITWLSATTERKATERTQTLQTLEGAVGRIGGSLVVGGQASSHWNLSSSSATFRAESMVELAAFASGVLRLQRSTSVE